MTPPPAPEPVIRVRDLPDETATADLARALARLARPGDVLALEGTLGIGKTAFARAFVRAATGNPDEEVPSPTFTLVQMYDSPIGPIHHFDLYRLEHPEDSFELGVEDAFAEGISLIEWPERLGAVLPRDRLSVRLEPGPTAQARRATLTAGPGWARRLAEMPS